MGAPRGRVTLRLGCAGRQVMYLQGGVALGLACVSHTGLLRGGWKGGRPSGGGSSGGSGMAGERPQRYFGGRLSASGHARVLYTCVNVTARLPSPRCARQRARGPGGEGGSSIEKNRARPDSHPRHRTASWRKGFRVHGPRRRGALSSQRVHDIGRRERFKRL